MSVLKLYVAVLVTFVIGNGIGEERCREYYKNYSDTIIPIKISTDFPINRKISSIDIRKIKQSRLVSLDGNLSSLVNELMPMSCSLFDFYLFDRIEISNSIESYVICAINKSTENEESYAYVVNLKDSYLKSMTMVSCYYHRSYLGDSSVDYGRLYSTIGSGSLLLYECAYRADDIYEGTVNEVPWYVEVRIWLRNIFSSTKIHYTKVLSLSLDESGFLY